MPTPPPVSLLPLTGDWLLIKDGVVVNSIIADRAFITYLGSTFDYYVEVFQNPGDAGIGWTYNPGTGVFTGPAGQTMATPTQLAPE